MFDDLIKLLFEKKEANRRDYEAREAKLDELLTACGYVAEVATTDKETAAEPVPNFASGETRVDPPN